jgi:single-stranded DNA-binding protein
VNVWRGQAEHLADSLGKGDRVLVTGRLRQRSWETPEGDKRSVTEIEADEVGASLKWATAKVERASQRGNGDGAQGRERAPSVAATSTTPRRLIDRTYAVGRRWAGLAFRGAGGDLEVQRAGGTVQARRHRRHLRRELRVLATAMLPLWRLFCSALRPTLTT